MTFKSAAELRASLRACDGQMWRDRNALTDALLDVVVHQEERIEKLERQALTRSSTE